jgi:hypothetical protein
MFIIFIAYIRNLYEKITFMENKDSTYTLKIIFPTCKAKCDSNSTADENSGRSEVADIHGKRRYDREAVDRELKRLFQCLLWQLTTPSPMQNIRYP